MGIVRVQVSEHRRNWSSSILSFLLVITPSGSSWILGQFSYLISIVVAILGSCLRFRGIQTSGVFTLSAQIPSHLRHRRKRICCNASSREVKPSTPSVCVLSKPDSRISTSRDATTVLTTLGICIVWPSDSFRFLVPYATSWRNDVLEIKSKKWSTLTGSRRHRCKTGGSITWPGLLRFACFLASSILHYYLILGDCLVILF